MRQFLLFQLTGITLLVLLIIDCATQNSKISPALQQEDSKKSEISIEEGWQTQWERTLSEAKKEGTIVIITARTPEVREPLTRAFKEKFGLDLECIVGGVAEIPQKILTERRAGIYSPDIHLGGAQPMLIMLKPHGVP